MDRPYIKRKKGCPIEPYKPPIIEKIKYEKYSEYIEENDCCICLDSLTNTTIVKSKNCMHIFHKECINEWLNDIDHWKCPTCNCFLNPLNLQEIEKKQ